jgi:anti-sigma factor RsiW
MKNAVTTDCPRTEQISALMDGELARASRAEIEAHAASCPVCGRMFSDLTELRAAFQPLAGERLELDLAPLVDRRLGSLQAPRRPARDRGRAPVWQWLGSGVAAAAVLSAGVYLGSLLAAGGAASATQNAAMAVFDPVPPGGLYRTAILLLGIP